jgi:hypothetical protein
MAVLDKNMELFAKGITLMILSKKQFTDNFLCEYTQTRRLETTFKIIISFRNKRSKEYFYLLGYDAVK